MFSNLVPLTKKKTVIAMIKLLIIIKLNLTHQLVFLNQFTSNLKFKKFDCHKLCTTLSLMKLIGFHLLIDGNPIIKTLRIINK